MGKCVEIEAVKESLGLVAGVGGPRFPSNFGF